MKRMIYQLGAVLFGMMIIACAKTDPVAEALPEQPITTKGYALSVEVALHNLEGELAALYPATRNSSPKQFKAVKTITPEALPRTRATESLDDVENLLYLVEFADGGSAVLGADKRIDPVMAVLDETVLTPENFTQGSSDESDISNYIATLLAESAAAQVASFEPIPEGEFPITDLVYEYDTLYHYHRAPQLETKWHQNSPFNNQAPLTDNGLRYPAGCGPIAIGQILLYNRYPDIISINGENFSWNLLEQLKYGCMPTFTACDEAARFIRAIMDYGNACCNPVNNNTEMKEDDIKRVLRHVGYSSVTTRLFSLENVKSYGGRGVCMLGKTADNKGHAWVIDGYNEYKVQIWVMRKGITGEIMPDTRMLFGEKVYEKVHCNYGWAGKCDGYYSTLTFNVTTSLRDEDIDESIGDNPGTELYNFDRDLKMITYTLNQ